MLRSLFQNCEYKKCAYFAEISLNENKNFSNEILFYYSYSHYMHNKVKNEDKPSDGQSKEKNNN